ncbi:MAG: TorF family putative porin [Pseudomonadota bacterium]|nr:TorF family putative porin [Pseudomonadota bacterium]
MNKPLLTTLFIASTSLLAHAEVSLSANMGLQTDYIWRGMTQNAGDPSIHGGFDLKSDSGFYTGTWAASTSSGTELDYYAGYALSIGDAEIDIGYIDYTYVQHTAEDISERYLGLGATYGFLDSLSIYVDYSYTDDYDASGDSADIAGMGAYYHFGDLVIELAYQQFSYKTTSMEDFNSTRIGLRYDLGGGLAATLTHDDKAYNMTSQEFSSATSFGLKFTSQSNKSC